MQNDERNKVGCVGAALVLVLAAGGWVVQKVEDHYLAKRSEVFESGEFSLVVLREAGDELRPKLAAAAEQVAVDGQEVLTIPDVFVAKGEQPPSGGVGERKFFRTNGLNVPGAPPVRFIVQHPFFGKKKYETIYEIFRSNALDKTRSWLRDNGYSQADVPLAWELKRGEYTVSVNPKKGNSEISIMAYFDSGGHTWVWTGGKVVKLGNDDYVNGIKHLGK